jgi:RimJ/RimL family protein N-acetyltransferase
MMERKPLLKGENVSLVACEPKRDAPLLSRWSHNGEYLRLLDADPARLWSAEGSQKWLEEECELEHPNMILFMIQANQSEELIGFVDLSGMNWLTKDSMIGIALGDPAYWGRGYGTEAMRLVLRYGFTVLGLHRMSLNVFDYNPRAIRSYEKAGFRVEGRLREALNRDGRRWDMLYMGILREAWLANNPPGGESGGAQ